MHLPAAIIFDLDGTLVDRRATLTAAGRALGVDVSTLLNADPTGRLGVQQQLRHLPDVTLAAWRSAILEHVSPTPGVDVMRELQRRGVRTALLTNGSSRMQRAKIERLELTADAIVVSGEVGLRKPDPAIFRLVLDRLGVSPADAWMVGDDEQLDLHPARQLGLTAVHAKHLTTIENLLAAATSIG